MTQSDDPRNRNFCNCNSIPCNCQHHQFHYQLSNDELNAWRVSLNRALGIHAETKSAPISDDLAQLCENARNALNNIKF